MASIQPCLESGAPPARRAGSKAAGREGEVAAIFCGVFNLYGSSPLGCSLPFPPCWSLLAPTPLVSIAILRRCNCSCILRLG